MTRRIIILSLMLTCLNYAKSRPPHVIHLKVYVFENVYILKGKEVTLKDIEKELKKYSIEDRQDGYIFIVKKKKVTEKRVQKLKEILKKLDLKEINEGFLKDSYSKEKVIKEYKP